MLRAPLAILLVLSVTLAGCVALPEEVEELTPAAALVSPEGAPLNLTVDDWFIINVTATPEASLTGFWWSVPTGAVVEDALFSWFDQKAETTVLEVALSLPAKAPALEEWALLAFEREDGELELLAQAVSTSYAWRTHGLGAKEGEEAAWMDPFFFRMGVDSLSEGEPVAFVFAARSEQPTPVQLAFRALPKDPWGDRDTDPAGDAAAFLRERASRPPVRLAPNGTGEGLQLAAHVEFQGVDAFPYSYEGWTLALQREGEVDPDVRPAAAARDQTFAASFDSPEGFGDAFAIYWADQSVGEWSVMADVRDQSVEKEGPIRQAARVGTFLHGLPFFGIVGDGAGPSASAFHVSTTTVNVGGYEVLVFAQLDLGASLSTLVGEPAATDAWTYEGLLPTMGVTIEGRHLHVPAPEGPYRVHLGLLPAT